MVITKELKDELNAILKVSINKDDYEPNVEKKLTDYRKKAKIDGFRPGKVPSGMIRKLYGKSVLVDEINHLISENIQKYIHDEHIQLLGDPLPSDTEQKPIDWENSTDFEFVFDLGLAPEFEVNLSKKEKIINYSIMPEAKLIQTYTDNYTRRFGAYKACNEIVDGNELLKGTIVELTPLETFKDGGYHVSESSIYLEYMKDDEIKKKFIGLKTNDSISFNLRKAFPNNVELASILHVKKEEVVNINADFQFTIIEITKFEKAEINQELFDKVFGEGVVTSPEQFQSNIENEVKTNLSLESFNRFRTDAKNALLQKTNFKLPAEFLKRWLLSSNEGKSTVEEIERDFDKFEDDLKWQLVKNKIISDHDLKLSDDEILDFAKKQTRYQLEHYGLVNVTEEQITKYAQESLKQDDFRRRVLEQKYEDKVLDFIRESVTLDTKIVTTEEFDKILESITG